MLFGTKKCITKKPGRRHTKILSGCLCTEQGYVSNHQTYHWVLFLNSTQDNLS